MLHNVFGFGLWVDGWKHVLTHPKKNSAVQPIMPSMAKYVKQLYPGIY